MFSIIVDRKKNGRFCKPYFRMPDGTFGVKPREHIKRRFSVKRQRGVYYTKHTPFNHTCFINWLNQIDHIRAVEPFAGACDICKMLPNIDFACFDISPQNDSTVQQDTILCFPTGYNLCITNPPYLAKNSAKRRKLKFPETKYDDLYKLALEQCLKNCEYVAAIIPESFITADIFTNRLVAVISLTQEMFSDTDCPVCLALFNPWTTEGFEVWNTKGYIGNIKELSAFKPVPANVNFNIIFNSPFGDIGLRAIDGTSGASIRFCSGDEIPSDKIKHSSRSLTRISIIPNLTVEQQAELIQHCNATIANYREKTSDVFMTSFKGLRKDGKYRRRIDFVTARHILQGGLECVVG